MIRVAIAERRRLMGQLLAHLVQGEQDMEVVGLFSDGTDLLERVSHGGVDVVLLGVIGVPRMEVDLISRIRQNRPSTQVVVMVAGRQDSQLAAVVRAGATGHISEGTDVTELLEAIRSAALGESSISRELALQLLDAYVHPRQTQVDLTGRERSVLAAIIRGESNREIAEQLGLSEKTVKNYVTAILDKLGVRDRTQAAVFALQAGILEEMAVH